MNPLRIKYHYVGTAAILVVAALFSFPNLIQAQNKFFATPNRGGVEGSRGTAQIEVLLGENKRANTCTAAGLIFAPTHPAADANGCTSAAGQRDLTSGLTVGGSAQVSGSLSVGGELSVTGQVNLPGGVGIGSSPAATTLDVAGAIKVAGGSETCDGSKEGSIRYNSSSQKMEFCNGTAWGLMSGGGGVATVGEKNGGAAEWIEESITLDAPSTVIFSGYGYANYSVGAIANAGNYIFLYVGSDWCATDMSFEGESSTVSFYSSATCIKRLAAGTHTLRSRHYVAPPGSTTRHVNRLQYIVFADADGSVVVSGGGGSGSGGSGGGPTDVPSGAVMAFNLSFCPTGWSAFSGAQGRFIVGSGALGSDSYALGETGGSAHHALTEEEMPPHTHQTWSRIGSAQASNSPTPYALMQPGYYNEPTSWTGGVAPGGARPHENRPPYLALLYCQKS